MTPRACVLILGQALFACGAAPAERLVEAPIEKVAQPPVQLVEDGAAGTWAIATPEAAGLQRAALDRLVRESERTGTDALLVLRGDEAVVARTFGNPRRRLEVMSITKGFVGIAIELLIEDGKIASLDAPISTWFPEWNVGKKALVTLRHVMNHSSGLAHKAAGGELARQPDRLAYVRALPIELEPGTVFSYNNEATQLLSGVAQAAVGEALDTYLQRRLFDPLGIPRIDWRRDAAGNVMASEGLSLSAEELAKVGVVLRDHGVYKGAVVLPPAVLTRMQEPSKNASWHGALTWLLYDGPWQVQSATRREALVAQGFDRESKLTPLDGKRFPTRAAYWMEAGALLAPAERELLGRMMQDDLLPLASVEGELVGFDFNGWLGQFLVIYPGGGVVAVRQHREPPNVTDDDNQKIGMLHFPALVREAIAR